MDKTAWGLASFLWSCAWAVCALAGAVASRYQPWWHWGLHPGGSARLRGLLLKPLQDLRLW